MNFIRVVCLTIVFSFLGSSIYALENDEIFIKKGNPKNKVIALTFDDGPHPKETYEVLDILKKHNVKATFFVAGKPVNWYTDVFLKTVSEGHEIGNHTFNHTNISNLSKSQIEREIIECEKIIYDLTGKKTNIFRPPYGKYNEKELKEIAIENGYNIVLWATLDVMDWKNPSAYEIAKTIVDKAENGDIILLHDYGTNNTVEALDILIPKMKEKGFEFVTVSDIIKELE